MSFSQPVPCTGSRTVFKESYDDTQCIVHCVRHAPDEQGHYPALACRSGRRCQRVGLVGIQRKMACGCRSSRTATTVAYLPACLLHGSYLNIQSARRTFPWHACLCSCVWPSSFFSRGESHISIGIRIYPTIWYYIHVQARSPFTVYSCPPYCHIRFLCLLKMTCIGLYSVSLDCIPFDFVQADIALIRQWMVQVRYTNPAHENTTSKWYESRKILVWTLDMCFKSTCRATSKIISVLRVYVPNFRLLRVPQCVTLWDMCMGYVQVMYQEGEKSSTCAHPGLCTNWVWAQACKFRWRSLMDGAWVM